MDFLTKYAPQSIDDVIFSDKRAETKFKAWAADPNNRRPVLLYGDTGTGKTTLVDMIPFLRDPTVTDYDVLEIAAHSTVKVDALIKEVQHHCKTVSQSVSGNKFVVIDEVDNLSASTQQSVSILMSPKGCPGGIHPTTTFCLTTNNLGKVIPPLKSRCMTINMDHRNMNEFVPFARKVLKKEGLKGLSDAAILSYANLAGGDVRDLLELLEDLVAQHRASNGKVLNFPKPPGK